MACDSTNELNKPITSLHLIVKLQINEIKFFFQILNFDTYHAILFL